jgi:hypothetical protein
MFPDEFWGQGWDTKVLPDTSCLGTFADLYGRVVAPCQHSNKRQAKIVLTTNPRTMVWESGEKNEHWTSCSSWKMDITGRKHGSWSQRIRGWNWEWSLRKQSRLWMTVKNEGHTWHCVVSQTQQWLEHWLQTILGGSEGQSYGKQKDHRCHKAQVQVK